MKKAVKTVSIEQARGLALHKQLLAGDPVAPTIDGLHDVMIRLGCLQLDPTSAVAPNHLLVLWSRLGAYNTTLVDRLLWEERRWFEYWAHAASIVATSDYPIHRLQMRLFGGEGKWHRQVRDFMEENASLRRHILTRLRREGPLPARAFQDRSSRSWESSGWTNERNVGRMLDFLWVKLSVLVSSRKGRTRWWDLAGRVLPDWTPRDSLAESAIVAHAAQRSLRALGIAGSGEIKKHFTRDRYPNLPRVLARLEARGVIERIDVDDGGRTRPVPRYIHSEDLPLLQRLESKVTDSRTTLLSPFDNLICDRARTSWLFGFDFSLEIYKPADQRKFGFFVMPILHEGRLIGRVDPTMDRKARILRINAVHLEAGAPRGRKVAEATGAAVEQLAGWLGADRVQWHGTPAPWRKWLD